MSIYIATQRELNEIGDLLRKYRTGVEIQPFCFPIILDDPESIMDDVKKNISATKRRSLHAPYFGLNPACVDHKIGSIANERFSKAYLIGKELNVSNIVFHTGYFFYFKPCPDTVKRFGEFWNAFIQGKDENIQIHFENVFEKKWEYLKELIDTIDSDRVSVCLDLGHVNTNSDQDIEQWIKGFKGKIKYVHIHNNYGEEDNHYGLQRGTIDMYRVLNLLKEYSMEAIWTIETSEIEESINWLIKNKFYDINSLG